MAQIIEAINRLNMAERMQVLEYLCTSLVPHFNSETPEWHDDALHETEARVESGEETFMSLAESKRLFAEQVHAR